MRPENMRSKPLPQRTQSYTERIHGVQSKAPSRSSVKLSALCGGVFLPVIPIHHSLDPILQMLNMEIDQQANLSSTQAHVRQQLSLMYGIDCFDTLDLDYDAVRNDEINAISEIDLLAQINDRKSNFTGDLEAMFSKFVDEARAICAFKQTGAKRSMNSHCGADDLTRDLIDLRSDLLRRCSHE